MGGGGGDVREKEGDDKVIPAKAVLSSAVLLLSCWGQ